MNTPLSRCPQIMAGLHFKCCALGALLLVLLLLSVVLGAATLPLADVLAALAPEADRTSTAYQVIWNLRLPRTILAILVGINFALAGLILQVVIRNPLAEPGILGISAGGSLGIVIMLLLADNLVDAMGTFFSGSLSLNALPIAAFAGGLAASAVILAISWRAGINPARLALNGVALGAVINALVMWMVVGWGGGRTETTLLWLAGSLYGRGPSHIPVILPWTCAALACFVVMIKPLSLLRLGDDLAASLGLKINPWRCFAIIVAVALATSATAVTGPIGFVGLVTPHLARLISGSDLHAFTLITLICGPCIMLAADLVCRLAIAPLELPVGAMTTLLGIPVFLLLLQRQKGVAA